MVDWDGPLALKVGGAEGARTPDPHNAIVLIPIALESHTNAVKNIDRFIDSFFPDSIAMDLLAHNTVGPN